MCVSKLCVVVNGGMCSIAAGFVASMLVGTRFGGAGLVAVEISAERVGGIATWHCWSMGSKWSANMTRGFGKAGKAEGRVVPTSGEGFFDARFRKATSYAYQAIPENFRWASRIVCW